FVMCPHPAQVRSEAGRPCCGAAPMIGSQETGGPRDVTGWTHARPAPEACGQYSERMRSPVQSYLLSLHETVSRADPFTDARLSRHRTAAAPEPEADALVLYDADPARMGIA